jgi:hypothetical protein
MATSAAVSTAVAAVATGRARIRLPTSTSSASTNPKRGGPPALLCSSRHTRAQAVRQDGIVGADLALDVGQCSAFSFAEHAAVLP